MWKVTLILIVALMSGCYGDIEVDLSGIDEPLLNLFISDYVLTFPVILLAYGLPTFVNDRYVQDPLYDLFQMAPNETTVTWNWFGQEITFYSLVDIECVPIVSHCSSSDLTIEYLRVCKVDKELCVEFEVHGFELLGRKTAYRMELLVGEGDTWHILWGGYPILNWSGSRAFRGVGWVDETITKRLSKKKKFVMLLVVTDLFTEVQRKAVKPIEL